MPPLIAAKAFPRRAAHSSGRRVDDARLRRQSAHLRRLGDRSVYEYIRWIADGADPIEALNAFDRLDPSIVKYLGADRPDLEEEGR
jgi:hypothetical protein